MHQDRTELPLLIDEAMPAYDCRIAEHLVVGADPAATYQAACTLDFLTVRSPLLVAAMWVRGLPARMRGSNPDTPPRLVLGQKPGLPGWLVLGRRPGAEFVFGAVGTFWSPTIVWHDVAAVDFTDFAEPGWGKIAANFSVVPYGGQATILTYECRTVTTDPESRRRFLRYWWLIRPFVAHIMRATLRTVAANAERPS